MHTEHMHAGNSLCKTDFYFGDKVTAVNHKLNLVSLYLYFFSSANYNNCHFSLRGIWWNEEQNKNHKSGRKAKLMSSSVPAGLSLRSVLLFLKICCLTKLGDGRKLCYICKNPASARATSREAFYIDGCIGGVVSVSVIERGGSWQMRKNGGLSL